MQPDERALERIFERAREPAPPGLEDRVVASLSDPQVARRFRLEDTAEFVAKAVRVSAAVFLVAAILMTIVVAFGPNPRSAAPPLTPPAPVRDPVRDEELLALVGASRTRARTSAWPVEVSGP